jgi:hypothetical protein
MFTSSFISIAERSLEMVELTVGKLSGTAHYLALKEIFDKV